jgi:hypothetical protein
MEKRADWLLMSIAVVAMCVCSYFARKSTGDEHAAWLMYIVSVMVMYYERRLRADVNDLQIRINRLEKK